MLKYFKSSFILFGLGLIAAFFIGGIALFIWTTINNKKYKARKVAIKQNINDFIRRNSN